MVTCPHCDSARIEQMLDRTYESRATNTWYQCKNCRRMDGYALCEVLRRDSTTRTVPILLVTTPTTIPALDRARAIGVDGVLTKPVTPDALREAVERLLGTSCNS